MSFFEGDDFKNSPFKALMPRYYPKKYQDYIIEEEALLKEKLNGIGTLLEAGVGIGRLIPVLAPIVHEFTGLDSADLMIKEAKKIACQFPNVTLVKGAFENATKIFSEKYFDSSVCLWNTLGNVHDEVVVLDQFKKITKDRIFISVYLKGTLPDRIDWYKTIGIEIDCIDRENEIFYTKSGLRSKSFSLQDIESIASRSGLQITETRILSGVMLWVGFQV